jgi:hypothetical protein
VSVSGNFGVEIALIRNFVDGQETRIFGPYRFESGSLTCFYRANYRRLLNEGILRADMQSPSPPPNLKYEEGFEGLQEARENRRGL